MKQKVIRLSPPQLLVVTFLFFIILGMGLLKLPFATTEQISWLDALFTTTSAMTVTGLAVVDTGGAFTLFGEVVVMSLIQIGGLGIMSFAVLIFMMLGKKIGFKERLLLQQALNQTSVGGVIKLVKYLFIFSFIVEGFAVLLLATEWVPEFGWKRGLYVSIFHSISAFNNAGFSLFSDSLMGYVGSPIINLTISFLFILGGIGFTVLVDLWKSKTIRQLSLHTKIMVIGTFLINVIAFMMIFVLEFNNPNTLAQLPLSDKIFASYFQAVTPRTAGFNSLDYGSMERSTLLFTILLMFIGAGSASTGGGIKLTTFVVISLSMIAFLKEKKEIRIFRRTIDQAHIFKALALSMISVLLVFTALFFLEMTEHDVSFLSIVFEVVSAFGTVGLSMGITGSLSAIGKCIIIVVMFAGKLGPLTLAFSLSRPDKEKIRYPKEDILTG
ncbi:MULTISPECIES: TrkH family potassium uptake protein [unclassified Rossellomorea]|uniref:TrkH family potassium uptake protein n=1 Tax=unclassified Rossellomorea TaxID=2837526 RepID=UPI0020C63BFE|nr:MULTISPECIES: TrkH family potassium uptake protein [unclassified Rossellomorea]UTE77271.1 TrkH family potassium uptake protein [Rossellomorea sp. KS-H15a]WGG45192.1 TrkH family potassium uptake protein [Rossellomorea sp. DA94]